MVQQITFLPEPTSSADAVHMQLYALTCEHTLKIPNTGSRIIVWTHKILHTLTAMGGAALGAAGPYPGKVT